MSAEKLKIITGDQGLPTDMVVRNHLLSYADANHILGQMASVWHEKTSGKTQDVLENGLLRARFDHRMLRYEMNRLERALLGTTIRPILLKGAAYVAAGLKAGRGRRVSDIDILVPEDELAETEKLLMAAGWQFDEETANSYDQDYYRRYMHELPPMRHSQRRTLIDVHHRLLPRTSRVEVDPAPFFAGAEVVSGSSLRIFNKLDMFIHASIHSFSDGSFDTPARSMMELSYLFQEIDSDDEGRLLARIEEVGAAMPCGTALYMIGALFADERAKSLQVQCSDCASGLVLKALQNKLADTDKAVFSKLLLYVRSHFMRMSLWQLALHFVVKLGRRLKNPLGRSAPPDF